MVIALLAGLLLGSWLVWLVGPALAQQPSLDTALARAAGKGFLISLVRPELSGSRDFYLLDRVNATGTVEDLGQVTSYQIVAEQWVNNNKTYQIEAVVQPGNRALTLFSGKYNGRWRIEGLELAAASLTVSQANPTTNPAPAGPAAVSGNGSGVLVFQTQSGGDFYKINADGTGLQRLSHGIDPQLSPDGRQVVFTRWEPRYELFTINSDGSGERAWTHNWRQMKSPTWTADGKALVFSYQEGGQLDPEAARINLEQAAREGDRIDIPRDAVGVNVDFGILTYVIPADAFWRLKRLELDTGQFSDLATELHSYGPSGHPNQADLVAYKGRNGIAINNTTTQTDQGVTTDHRDHTPVISPDGSRVAVSYEQDGHWEVHVMNLDGSNRQRLTTTPLWIIARQGGIERQAVMGQERFVARANPWWNNAAPTWSPDGSQIAFLTDRTGQWEIWIMKADGSNQRPMFPNGALAGIKLNYAGVDERMLSWR
jgi:dipeptidyl aminopeptidase/acylaminoacyl peptidase